MSSKDLFKNSITKEELDKFYKTSTGQRAALLSAALQEELANWDFKKIGIEKELKNCYDLLDWINLQKPDTLSALAVYYRELGDLNKSFFSFLYQMKKNRLKNGIKESEDYLNTLNKRGKDLVNQIKRLYSEYHNHIKSRPNVTAYEFGIYGKNLFKPRY